MQVNAYPEAVVLPEIAPIQSLEALEVLVDGTRHRIATLLMDEELTAKQLSERLGIGRTRLYYHLALLQRHGLIGVSGTRLVSGLEERAYRAVARTFRVDRALMAPRATEPQIADTQGAILEAIAGDLRSRAALGNARPEASDADVLVSRAFLRLSDERRRELRQRLVALVEEYRQPDPAGRETQVGLALFGMERAEQ